MGESPARRRRDRRRRARRWPPRVLLRAGPLLPRRLAWRPHADTIVRVLRLAGHARRARRRLPRVGRRADPGGPRGAGRVRPDLPRARALSGRVPQVSVICGHSAGGGSYSPALTDFVVMTKRGNMFLTGPGVRP